MATESCGDHERRRARDRLRHGLGNILRARNRCDPAKQILRQRDVVIAEVAERVGYSSVSAFGVAFTRHVGVSPGRFSRRDVTKA